MKKLLAFVFLALLASLGFAQDMETIILIERNNVVKFLPVNIPFQSISFEYERMINHKNSVTLGIGLPNQRSIMGKYGIDASSDLKAIELGTMHIRAAYRHYTGNRLLPVGFYYEPYFKYQNISGTARVEGENVENGYTAPYKGDFDIKLHSFNLGMQLGVQFLIANRVTLDLYFLGLEGGFLSGNVTATSPNIADANNVVNLKAEIEKSIDDLPSFIGDKLKVTQPSSNQINVRASSVPYPWLRGGISIGIAF